MPLSFWPSYSLCSISSLTLAYSILAPLSDSNVTVLLMVFQSLSPDDSHLHQTALVSAIRHHGSVRIYNRMRILSFLLTLQFIFPWCSSTFVPRTYPNPASCPTSHNVRALQASLVHALRVLQTVFYNCCTHLSAKDQCRKKNRSYCHLHTFVLGCCSCSFKASRFLYLSYEVANCHASLFVRRWR